jgi:surface carbohydrate biosynthesis protein (TIGR04326 family)
MQSPAEKRRSLLIWDVEGESPQFDGTIVLWRQYAGVDDPFVISMPQQVERQAEELRARYLAWVHDLGEAQIRGKRVIDHLELRPGLSYWWMSSPAQKFSFSETSGINDAIKTLALEALVAMRQANSIVLTSGNCRLAACLQGFCGTAGLSFEWRRVPVSGTPETGLRSLYRLLPLTWQALIYLGRYAFSAVPFILRPRSATPTRGGESLFVDVLVHLDKRASESGVFVSNYWTVLVDKLTDWRTKTNWQHMFFRHSAISTLGKAGRLLECFNGSAKGWQFHQMVEQSLNVRVLRTALRDYVRVRQTFASLPEIADVRPAGSRLDLWLLHADEWAASFCGATAMSNCLWVALFESAVGQLPRQKIGVYIQENQPWEMAFSHAWRTAGHGILIGTPHTAIRFWDLRYHFDARCYDRCGNNGLPLPDILAVNGPAGRKSILAGGYPAGSVTEVEALRFLHLLKRSPGRPADTSLRRGLCILVCGDFLVAANRQIVAWLEIAAAALPPDTEIVFKSHPAYLFDPAEHSALKLNLSDAPLTELLGGCDVVFASNTTSAAVDAYCADIPVVQMLGGTTFNMSPLRGLPGVTYVTHPGELAGALKAVLQRGAYSAEPYFCLDQELPRWKKLLGIEAALNQSAVPA